MTDNLKDKAIQIQGKPYILVSDRVLDFNKEYQNGSIVTQLISEPAAEMVIIKAKVTPDLDKPERFFTGYSQATWGEGFINKTAALENCETSAVGRALGMMGIGVIDSIASADEVKKATTQRPYAPKQPMTGLATEKQVDAVLKLSKKTGRAMSLDEANELTKQRASELIDTMMKELG